jgi:hypothetical protein
LFSPPRNPSQPPFKKGRRRVSPFEKGGLRAIFGGSFWLLEACDELSNLSVPFGAEKRFLNFKRREKAGAKKNSHA